MGDEIPHASHTPRPLTHKHVRSSFPSLPKELHHPFQLSQCLLSTFYDDVKTKQSSSRYWTVVSFPFLRNNLHPGINHFLSLVQLFRSGCDFTNSLPNSLTEQDFGMAGNSSAMESPLQTSLLDGALSPAALNWTSCSRELPLITCPDFCPGSCLGVAFTSFLCPQPCFQDTWPTLLADGQSHGKHVFQEHP